MKLYRRSREEYMRAMQAAGLEVLEAVAPTLEELGKLGR
ncbi:Uncharacterised protein [uncultured archaeon]|nr:Uncharacterised protein [uncultured archaeon]